MKQSKSLLKQFSGNKDGWEEVIDFTKIKKGGIDLDELQKRLGGKFIKCKNK